MSGPFVDLVNLTQAALIVLKPTGISYGNQVCGHACAFPTAEGFLVPIDSDPPLAEPDRGICPRLMKRFKSGIGALSPEDADFIDALLAESIYTRGIRVDRSRLPPPWSVAGDVSMEAWVHVTLGDWIRDADYLAALNDSNAKAAILTWPNSD